MKKLLAALLILLSLTGCGDTINKYASTERCIVMGKINNTKMTWTILEVDGNKALVVLNHNVSTLLTLMYNNVDEKVSWNNSYIRKYLNDDFYNPVFSDEEKKLIIKTNVEDSKDHLFLASKDEINKYVENIMAKYSNNSDKYRSISNLKNSFCMTREQYYNGYVYVDGFDSNNYCMKFKNSSGYTEKDQVFPLMWVDISNMAIYENKDKAIADDPMKD